MKILGIIQARMQSTRLPGKVMTPVSGKPIIWHIYNRMKSSKLLSEVVISTGPIQTNSDISDFAINSNIPIFHGNEQDLIDRLYQTAKYYNADAIVRVTSDCPIVEPELIDLIIEKYISKKSNYDVITNCQEHTFAHGLELELYSIDTLEKIWNEVKKPELREWFPLYVYANPDKFKILNIKNNTNDTHFRLTLDYPEDLILIKKIYEVFFNENHIFHSNQILDFLRKNPDLQKINSKHSDSRNIDAPKL